MKNNIHNLKVGQTIYDSRLHEYEVIKIGNKYAEIKSINVNTINILLNNLRYEDENYSQRNKQFYLTIEEPINQKDFNDNLKKIKIYFANSYYTDVAKDLTLEQTEQIIKMLKLENK